VGPTNQYRSRRFSKGAGDRKKKASSSKSGVLKIQERKGLSHKEADILYPVCSSVINVSKAVEFERKKANSQKLGVKNKSSKGNFYRTKRLTCGTQPAASSTFLRWQAMEKRQIARN